MKINTASVEFFSFLINDSGENKLRNLGNIFLKDAVNYSVGYKRYKMTECGLKGEGLEMFRFSTMEKLSGEIEI